MPNTPIKLKTDKKTQDYLTAQGIKTDQDLIKAVEKLSEESKDQTSFVTGIYAMFFPEWDDIKTIKGWPAIGRELNSFLFDTCMEFDRKHHPEVFSGGLWFNNGFSTDEKLGSWEIDMGQCEVILNTLDVMPERDPEPAPKPVCNIVEEGGFCEEKRDYMTEEKFKAQYDQEHEI